MLELFYIYIFYFRQVVMIWERYKLIKHMLWSTHWSEQKKNPWIYIFFEGKWLQSMHFLLHLNKEIRLTNFQHIG